MPSLLSLSSSRLFVIKQQCTKNPLSFNKIVILASLFIFLFVGIQLLSLPSSLRSFRLLQSLSECSFYLCNNRRLVQSLL